MRNRIDALKALIILGKTREGPEAYKNSEWDDNSGDTKKSKEGR